MSKKLIIFAFILLAACSGGKASATMISLLGNNGVEGLGSFTGNLSYTPIDAHTATLTISLTNTSPAANGGYLTALVFNNPGNDITGVSLATTAAAFQVLGAPSFKNSISASPYANFDIGASTGQGFLGGSGPKTGLAPGQSATFTFNLTGNLLSELTTLSFTHELSADGQFLLARFRGFDNGGSDKVPGFAATQATHAPIPSTLILVGSALAGLMIRRYRRS
jgi:hypothetical protein